MMRLGDPLVDLFAPMSIYAGIIYRARLISREKFAH